MGRSVAALLFLVLFVGVTRAVTRPEEYWKTVLPNAAMPGAVRDLLRPDVLDEKAGAGVDVGQNGVGRKKPVVVATPGLWYCWYPHPYWHRHPYGPFIYKYAATETQVHDNPNVAVFFQQEDLQPGAKMKLQFTRNGPGSAFIPRAAADALPFSSEKLPNIVTSFYVQPNSPAAKALRKTIKACEDPAAAGETRYCATSLESMVDFVTTTMGTRDVKAVSTEAGREDAPKQQYTVSASGVQKLAGGKSVTCHAEPYPYAVFYCHEARATQAYRVNLVGDDGSKVAAVAVCHTDTSAWNPGHLAFRLLKVKPGTVPICHFLPQDHIVWTPR